MYCKDVEEARRIFDTHGEYYNELEENNPNRKQLDQILFSMMNNVDGKKILDAGCGSGRYCKMLAEKGANVVGIDVSQKMIEMAKKRCRGCNAEFYLNDMERTGFPNNEFDVIISVFSILYKKNLSNVTKEFKRILKRGGELYLVISHPVRKMMKYTKNYFDTGKHWQDFGKIKIFNYYRTMEEYFKALLNEGFAIKEIRETRPVATSDNCFPLYLIIKVKLETF